ncbi:MAG: DUF72 domain-containing protein [Chloroflexi bacterium]|nr:DUF72 domain-containing protein [Chloroflexota bacterium]
MARVLIGISSWADKSLMESGFYPEEIKTPAERLRYYSQNFPVAEIDSSYHHFPTRRDLDLWLGNAVEGFVFDVKAFSLFTHHPTPFNSLPGTIRDEFGPRIKAKGNVYLHHLPPEAVDSLWQGFVRTIETFRRAGKFGAALFQFPPWFHPDSKNFDYMAHVRERLSSYPVAVEFRFGAWLDEANRKKTLGFLKEHGMALVCVDEPQGFASSVAPIAEVTAPPGFVRFHGRNREAWGRKDVTADEKFRYLYEENELEEWVPRIRAMAHEADELHIIFKNKHADFPVRNARQLGRMLGAASGTLTI